MLVPDELVARAWRRWRRRRGFTRLQFPRFHQAQTPPARRDSVDGARLGEAFHVMEAEVERLDHLVERLLALAKPVGATRSATDVVHLVESRLVLWSERAEERGVALEVRATPASAQPAQVGSSRFVTWS